jgi:hypothetical protein
VAAEEALSDGGILQTKLVTVLENWLMNGRC